MSEFDSECLPDEVLCHHMNMFDYMKNKFQWLDLPDDVKERIMHFTGRVHYLGKQPRDPKDPLDFVKYTEWVHDMNHKGHCGRGDRWD